MTLRWKFRDTNDSEYATSFYAGLKIVVQDCDGDFTCWHIEDPKALDVWGKVPTLARGECYTFNYKTDPYHFNHGLDIAEHAARGIARERKRQETGEPNPAPERTGSPSQAQTAFEQAKNPNPQTERGTESD
jgi:hypothetical protein